MSESYIKEQNRSGKTSEPGLYPGWAKRPPNVSAAQARTKLVTGNERYCQERATHPDSDRKRRTELLDEQHPFATILTCSDSRVSPEIVFDQGLGSLFVVRVAGNICDDAVLGTIEFAAMHLGVNLVIVMGHKGCGAVQATIENFDVDGPQTHSHIDALIRAISPAVQDTRQNTQNQNNPNFLEQSIRNNATMVAQQIRQADPIMNKLSPHGVLVQPAYYDLQSGQVRWLDEP